MKINHTLVVLGLALLLLCMGPETQTGNETHAGGGAQAAPGAQGGHSTGRSLGVRLAQGRASHKKFRSAEQVIGWINTYRSDPDPQRVPHAIRALSRFGAFEDIDQAGLYAGFLAGVLGNNQLRARQLIAQLFPMNPKSQAVIIMGIAYSGLPEWRALLGEFAERMPQRTVLIDKFMFGSARTLQEAPLDQSPDVVDALWGYYIATGYLQPVERLIGALRWTGETDNIGRFTLAHMALWTLAANAERDRPLLRFYRAQLAQQPKTITAPLKKIIHAAERFEAARLKKTVVATIAAQKRHKPGKYAKWAWPAKAGETLLAVGCVTATALGQAGLAAPCIVTGAIYSGVRKLMFEK